MKIIKKIKQFYTKNYKDILTTAVTVILLLLWFFTAIGAGCLYHFRLNGQLWSCENKIEKLQNNSCKS